MMQLVTKWTILLRALINLHVLASNTHQSWIDDRSGKMMLVSRNGSAAANDTSQHKVANKPFRKYEKSSNRPNSQHRDAKHVLGASNVYQDKRFDLSPWIEKLQTRQE